MPYPSLWDQWKLGQAVLDHWYSLLPLSKISLLWTEQNDYQHFYDLHIKNQPAHNNYEGGTMSCYLTVPYLHRRHDWQENIHRKSLKKQGWIGQSIGRRNIISKYMGGFQEELRKTPKNKTMNIDCILIK